MREGWEYKKLGDICEVINGRAYKKEELLNEGKYRVLRVGNFFSNDSWYYSDLELDEKNYCNNGDLLYAWSASFGPRIWDGEKAIFHYHIWKLEHNNLIDRKYFCYWLQSPYMTEQVSNQKHGATMSHLTKVIMENLVLSIPPLPEQQRIVSELDLLSSLIDKQKAQLKELDKLAQSIFYDMFGDPVENEKGWEVKKLGEIATASIGLTYKPDNVSDKGTIVLRSGNIQDSNISLTNLVRVDVSIPSSKIVKKGDILMCSRNGSFRLVGKVAIINDLPETMSYGAFMTIIRSEYNPYLFGFFKTSAFRDCLIQGKTTTVNQITVNMLQKIKLPLPPLPLQQLFAEKIQAIESQKASITQSIAETQKLFDYTMDKYFG